MKIAPILTLCLCLTTWSTWAIDPADSTVVHTDINVLPPEVKAELYRTFEGLSLGDTYTAGKEPFQWPEDVVVDSVEEQRAYAENLLARVEEEQRFMESLDALSEIELPVGIVKAGGSVDYSILIDRMTFTTTGAIMDVYVSLALPQAGQRIAFHGKVPLSHDGGIAGTAKVNLVGDHNIQMGNTKLTIKGTENTYVQFDCDGFQGVSLDAIVQFSRNLLIPEDENGQPVKDETKLVKINFTTYAQSLNDLMVSVTVPPFQVNGLSGFGFSVTQAFMDWSDLANPPGITFPEDYASPFVAAGQPLLWQGFYLDQLEVRLPPAFTKERNDGERITVGVEKMILDDQGFTGKFYADNVLELGRMSGWAYTLDHVELALVSNQVAGFGLEGKISVPNLKKKAGNTASQFGYVASRSANGDYTFAVSIEDELSLPLLVANLTLTQGSSITIAEKDDRFYPTVLLNGELAIGTSGSGPQASFMGIRFEGLRISTEAPRFDINAIAFGSAGSTQSVSKYPLVINNIGIQKEGETRLGIGFDVTVNIGGGAGEEGFGGTAALVVWGKRNVEEILDSDGEVTGYDEDKWEFDKVELSGLGINISKPGVFELAGMIRFFDDDPIYGDGFKGSLTGKIQMVTLSAEALFGRTTEFRYWYADAMVNIEAGIPMIPAILSAYGFGGGFYSNMKQSTETIASTLGTTSSGITYVPDDGSMGVRAVVLIGATRKEAWNGDVSLEIAMNKHGGINSVIFSGNANFMSAPTIAESKTKELASAAVSDKLAEKLAALIRGQVYASMKLVFDNVNDVFHGTFEVYVNVAAGLMRGVSDGNKAGWMEIHIEKGDWHVLIGTPDQPLGLEVARIFRSESYFMLGKDLPGSPPPPEQVTEILGNVDLDYMRDLNSLESGAGFAFGLRFTVDTGDLRFLLFYGRFAAGTGIDFMLKNYGDEYHCSGSSDPIGIKGWYANGQAYAFVMGKIGIKVRLRFYKGDFDILSIGAAAIMQAKGPNPFWMKGTVGGYYRILGGLVKGNCKFEVTVGNDCEIVGESNPLDGVDLIAEVSPVDGSTEIDVFNAPQAAFNIPIGEVFEITDIEDRTRVYRGKLTSFTVTDGTIKVPGNLTWNDNNDVVVFDSHDVLPPETELKATVRLTFEERVNGVWEKVYFDGEEVDEERETKFTTGTAPDYIPESNVAVSYPNKGQYNFYYQEYNKGFVQLKKGQPYLFQAGDEWQQAVHFNNVEAQTYATTTLSYNASDKRVNYTIPASGIQTNKAYTLQILNIPTANEEVDANVENVETALEDAGDDATLTTKSIEGDLTLRDAKTLYEIPLRTSMYTTFRNKMAAVSQYNTLNLSDGTGFVAILRCYYDGNEKFDRYELESVNSYGPVIRPVAVLSGIDWYNNLVYPLVYEGYPMLGSMTTTRDTAALGLPPARSVYLQQLDNAPLLTGEEESVTAEALSTFAFYDLMTPMVVDYRAIQCKVANYVVDRPDRVTDRFRKLLVDPFPFYRYGKYKLRLKYYIPGADKTTSSYDWELFNSIPD